MKKPRFTMFIGAALAALISVPLFAANTVFLTDRNGQISFPISPPNRANSTPGAIDNMTIGATTPAAITATSITAPSVTAKAAATATAAGSNAALTGGAGGSTSGAGGNATVTGGAGTAGNANGGDVSLTGGAANGTGVNGVVRVNGVQLSQQGAPAAKTVSATLTTAEVLTGIITVAQGAGATSAQQLPLATAMDTALPTSVAGDSFDFSVINTSVVDAEDASVTTNTGWTLVGEMDVQAHSALAAQGSSGRFRARKTATGAWTLYRLS
jgi:hypothetical protein